MDFTSSDWLNSPSLSAASAAQCAGLHTAALHLCCLPMDLAELQESKAWRFSFSASLLYGEASSPSPLVTFQKSLPSIQSMINSKISRHLGFPVGVMVWDKLGSAALADLKLLMACRASGLWFCPSETRTQMLSLTIFKFKDNTGLPGHWTRWSPGVSANLNCSMIHSGTKPIKAVFLEHFS